MSRALRAYLDTNVFIEWDTVPGRDEERFVAALRNGSLVAPPSLAEIEEILGSFEQKREEAIRPLITLRRLVGFHGMLKTPPTILEESIVAYANETLAPAVALPEAQRANIVRSLTEVLAGSTQYDAKAVAVVADVRKIKDQWRETMLERQARATAKAKAEGLYKAPPPPFPVFWHKPALSLAEAFAEKHGCSPAAQRRGLEGLLDSRPVRLGIGVVLSQIYSQLVPSTSRPQVRVPRRSDGYDVWHAILAGTADVFVTFDDRLAEHVEQIPEITGFRVVTSLGELLDLLP